MPCLKFLVPNRLRSAPPSLTRLLFVPSDLALGPQTLVSLLNKHLIGEIILYMLETYCTVSRPILSATTGSTLLNQTLGLSLRLAASSRICLIYSGPAL